MSFNKLALAAVCALTFAFSGLGTYAQDAGTLRAPSEIEAIGDERERSLAAYDEVAKVVTHPRCMNCHPRDDSPRQGEDMAMQMRFLQDKLPWGSILLRCIHCLCR